jgi:hypothetical protein
MSTHYSLLMGTTIQDGSHGICIYLRFDFLRWIHFRICASRLPSPTNERERSLRHLKPNCPTESQLSVRSCSTGLLGATPRHLDSSGKGSTRHDQA